MIASVVWFRGEFVQIQIKIVDGEPSLDGMQTRFCYLHLESDDDIAMYSWVSCAY